MGRKESVEKLSYASPRQPAPHPPCVRQVALIAALLGAIVSGVAVPWAVLQSGFIYDGVPSLMGGAIVGVAAMVIAAAAGALLCPAAVLVRYWIVWRLMGRP